MKYNLSILFILIANWSFSQDLHNQFLAACETSDTIKQLEILELWEKEAPTDPEYYTSRFNYHFAKSQKEVLEIRNDEPNGDALIINDSLGNNAGFIGSKIIYGSDEINKSFNFIDKGLQENPNRLDMRFGKIYVLGELEDWDSFTEEIIATIDYSTKKSSPWLWTYNEKQDGDNEFMLSAIQGYQLQLYNTQNDSLLLNMRSIANTILEIYPEHIESLSNLSITYTLLGELDKALKPLLKAETINPDDYIVIANIANTYKELNNKEKSIEYYKKLTKFEVDGVAEFAKQQIELLENE